MSDDKILESEIHEMAKLICKVSAYNVYDDDVLTSYIDNIVTCNKEPTHFVSYDYHY